MIRILQVVTHMNRGGLETMLMNYYRSIDRTQIQFDFLTHREYDGDYGEEIRFLGGTIYHLPSLNPFSPSYPKALRRFFASHPEYKVVHVHQDCMSGVVLKEAKRAGVPCRIAHSHSNNQDKDLKYLLKLVFRRSIPKYATDLFACSKEAGQWTFCGAPFTVLNNAIASDAYVFDPEKRKSKRNELNIRDDQLVIGHVGRFCYPKNHTFLVDIFAAVLKKRSALLLLVGDDSGSLGAEIHEKVKRLGIEGAVIFAGVRNDVADYLQAMDVFVFPSNYEGLGIAAIEAQASGLSCIVSDQVPPACKLTDLVTFISLKCSTEIWADAVLAAASAERRNTLEQIRDSGFDIKTNAEWLMRYYLEKYDQCKGL